MISPGGIYNGPVLGGAWAGSSTQLNISTPARASIPSILALMSISTFPPKKYISGPNCNAKRTVGVVPIVRSVDLFVGCYSLLNICYHVAVRARPPPTPRAKVGGGGPAKQPLWGFPGVFLRAHRPLFLLCCQHILPLCFGGPGLGGNQLQALCSFLGNIIFFGRQDLPPHKQVCQACPFHYGPEIWTWPPLPFFLQNFYPETPILFPFSPHFTEIFRPPGCIPDNVLVHACRRHCVLSLPKPPIYQKPPCVRNPNW